MYKKYFKLENITEQNKKKKIQPAPNLRCPAYDKYKKTSVLKEK